MKILLINPPIRLNTPPYFQPVGLAIVASTLRNGGHEIDFLDLNVIRCPEEEVYKHLPIKEYDFVGISGLITTYKYLHFLIPLLRKVYNAKIVVGGGGITSAPEVYMNNLCPDYGVIGEGEYTMLELASGAPESEILGLSYWRDGKVVFNPPRPVEKDLDKFPMQAFDLMDMETYCGNIRHQFNAKSEVAILTTRGCPYACHFCYHVFGRGVRYRSVNNVIEEMEYLIDNYEVETFEIGDECFTAKKSFVMEFCEEIVRRGIKTRWSAYSRVNTIDEEMMAAMKMAGCNWLGFGLESGSQKILDAMGKGVTIEQAKETWLLARKYFPIVMGTLIFGYPGEDNQTTSDTLRFLGDIGHIHGFFFLQPYPGTKVYNDNLDKILAKFGNLHNFFCALRDANRFTINLTDYPDDEYFVRKFDMERYLMDLKEKAIAKYLMGKHGGLERVVFYCAPHEKVDLVRRIDAVVQPMEK
jgi:radical SAM superfamily enzyme YgiQ (UPF0313 family)